jgi:predicted  nucleic acid-binding Zn-ribbon protein
MNDITTPATGHECNNCGEIFADDQIKPLSEVKDLAQRLDPGSEVPSGECLVCGALTYRYSAREREAQAAAETSQILTNGRYAELHRTAKKIYEVLLTNEPLSPELWRQFRTALHLEEKAEQ